MFYASRNRWVSNVCLSNVCLLDLIAGDGSLRVFALLHDARPVLLNPGEPGGFDIAAWADRVQLID